MRKYLPHLILFGCISHLTLAGLSAMHVRSESTAVWNQILTVYGSLTSSMHSFGFFAPGVSSQLKVDILAIKNNHKQPIALFTENREVNLRIDNMTNRFWHNPDGKDPEQVRRSLAASFASHAFAKEPAATSIVVKVKGYSLPSMEHYRSGHRPYWKDYYSAVFKRQ